MRTNELAEELADFWLSAIAGAGWEDRLTILREVDAQLAADIEKRSEYEAVCPRFVAAVIEQLGMPQVDCEPQAKIYALSAFPRHREAAKAWSERVLGASPSGSSAAIGGDRRRSPRQAVDVISEIWVHEQRASCQVVDLSKGGARLLLRELKASPGTAVRLVLPDVGVRDATVVFRNNVGIGVQFVDQPSAV